MWFATVADEISHDGSSDAGRNPSKKEKKDTYSSQKKPPADSPSDDGTKRFLMDKFGNWHPPVASLLRATKPGTIAREDARAMSRQVLRAVAEAGAGYRGQEGLRGEADSGGGGVAGRGVVLVGDAAHTVRALFSVGV